MDKKERLIEAYRIFADASLYSDRALLNYIALIKGLFDSTEKISHYIGTDEIYNVPITDNFFLISSINTAISLLPLNEQNFINMYYGLNGNRSTSLETIAAEKGLSMSKAIDLKFEILGHLLSPSKIVRAMIPFMKKENVERIIYANRLSYSPFLPIDTLFEDSPLSATQRTRARNSLVRHGISTIQEFIDYPCQKLKGLPNIGSKTFNYLIKKRKELVPTL